MVLIVLSYITILVLTTKINLVKHTNIIQDGSCQEPNLARSHGARDRLLLFAFSCGEVLTSVGLYRSWSRPAASTIGDGPRSPLPEIDVKSRNV